MTSTDADAGKTFEENAPQIDSKDYRNSRTDQNKRKILRQ
jgi:hypothetical protein